LGGAENAFLESPAFSPELKEVVRRALAFRNGCPYCMAKGAPSENPADPNVRAAVRAARALADGGADEEVFDQLKQAFSGQEISELLAYICFITACQKFGAFLDLRPVCDLRDRRP